MGISDLLHPAVVLAEGHQITGDRITLADALQTTIGVSINIDPAAGQGEDDSDAINDALDRALALRATGIRANVVLGPKVYNYLTPHTMMVYPVGIVGAGADQTFIKLDPLLEGDVFSWSDCWWKSNTNSTFMAQQKGGVLLRDFSVVGDRTSSNQQNVFMFYDRTDGLVIENVRCWFVRGRALAFGIISAQTEAFLRESRIRSFQASHCGLATIPVVEFHAAGTGDSTNSDEVYDLNVWGAFGPGVVLRNSNTVKNITLMNFYGLRVEGKVSPPVAVTEDLLVIGDATLQGGVSAINFFGLTLVAPYVDQWAFKTRAPDATAAGRIYEISGYGVVLGPGVGGGFDIEAGRIMNFDVIENSVSGSKLTVGAAAQGVGRDLYFNASGDEITWSPTIHATSAAFVKSRPTRLFTPPATAAAAGQVGEQASDTGFIYICTATNTWKRVAIATW